ncbi:MAG TPA: ORF6N domain-containing protein [Kiritimatiellia bacterium]|nr:ORF6N domain-containing protein [Kiritimatiellia bacterium]
MPAERIQKAIYLLRGQKVMLDRDLASLYGVETRALNQAVKRQRKRFPDDFMFELTRDEIRNISQTVTCLSSLKHARSAYVFTEQGVAMLSSVLNSDRAVQVNIAIMRAFVQLRQLLATHADLARKLEELEKKYDAQFRGVFDAIRRLMAPPAAPRKAIGFHVREKQGVYRVRKNKGAVVL